MFKQVSGKKESTAFNNIVDLLYHAILLHYGLGGRQRFEENGAQLSLFGEKLLTHHLSVGTSLTHNRKNKNKATGHTRCFLGAAIRGINSELYAALGLTDFISQKENKTTFITTVVVNKNLATH